MRKVRRIAEDVIIVCLICIMGICAYNIFQKEKAYHDSEKVYKEIPSMDFTELKKINPDVVAWLKYDPLEIDYPVVQGEDNDKYLNTLFDGNEGVSGCLFVDYICQNPFVQFNTIIYGHHMFNGTMFGEFGQLKEKEFAEKNPKFTLYLPNGKAYDLEIWAFLNSPSDSLAYSTNLDGQEEKEEYIENIENEAVYTIGDVDLYDRLVVLSTCAYEYQDARYIVICKMKEAPPKLAEVPPEPTRWEKFKEKAMEVRSKIRQKIGLE